MSRLFADAAYYIALANPKDQWHKAAVDVAKTAAATSFVTSEDVLVECLNFYSESGEYMRRTVASLIRSVLIDANVEIVGRSETSFLEALELYETRLDKGYSLTDCISMNFCRELGITDVITADKHFVQEGFRIILRHT